MPRSTQNSVHYLHPDGWSDRRDGALGRIRTRVSTRTQVLHDCIIDEPDGKGGWRERTTPATSRINDGWQWFAWRAMRAGEPLVIFRGVRPLSPDMAVSLCDGLTLHFTSGFVMESPDEAGLTFALSPSDAQRFRERVIAAGGHISATAPDPGRAGAAAAQLARDAAEAAGLAQQALNVIQGGHAAARTTVAQMDALMAAAWQCRARGVRARDELEQYSGIAIEAGIGTDEVVAHAALDIAAQSDWQRIEDSLSTITGAQREAALQIAAAESGPSSPQLVAPFDQWHGHIAARLRAQGQEARVEDGELVVDLPEGRLRLGQTARIEPINNS